jgi:hypothetical protein
MSIDGRQPPTTAGLPLFDAVSSATRIAIRPDRVSPPERSAKPTQTVTDAWDYIEAHLADGCACPACGQNCKVYKRKLYSNYALFLVTLVRAWAESQDDWIHYKDCKFTSRDYSYLQKWGLIKSKPVDAKSKGSSSGYWKPTQRGVAFANGRMDVPSHVYLWDNEIRTEYGVDGFTDVYVSITDALGDGFDYDELMGRTT